MTSPSACKPWAAAASEPQGRQGARLRAQQRTPPKPTHSPTHRGPQRARPERAPTQRGPPGRSLVRHAPARSPHALPRLRPCTKPAPTRSTTLLAQAARPWSRATRRLAPSLAHAAGCRVGQWQVGHAPRAHLAADAPNPAPRRACPKPHPPAAVRLRAPYARPTRCRKPHVRADRARSQTRAVSNPRPRLLCQLRWRAHPKRANSKRAADQVAMHARTAPHRLLLQDAPASTSSRASQPASRPLDAAPTLPGRVTGPQAPHPKHAAPATTPVPVRPHAADKPPVGPHRTRALPRKPLRRRRVQGPRVPARPPATALRSSPAATNLDRP
jgi:hypothetical protein